MSAADHISKKFANFQEFLDQHQYTREGILSYEKIFGYCYVSTGGENTTKDFVNQLQLQPGQKVLDVGCGIGGSAFYMAKHFGVSVHGLDLSTNMLTIAQERKKEVQAENVSFELADATKVEFPEASFDVIYSRDTILHIEDKLSLFQHFYKWLKPGGKVFISDYCCNTGPLSPDYVTYVHGRGYFVHSVEDYAALLSQAGFQHVNGEDKTDLFVECLSKEKERIVARREEFIKDGLSISNFDYIVQGWEAKLLRCAIGDQKWGVFLATRSE